MDLDFLDGSQEPKDEVQPVVTPEAPVEAAPEVTPEPVAETVEQTETRERDERGRFKPKDEPVMVPLQALHETRDKVKDLEARIAALQPQQPAAPDMFEDPEGFQQNLTSSVQGQILNATLNLSEEMVRQAAGDELVNAAQEWGKTAFQNDPGMFQKFIAQRNPYGFLVQQYQREQSLTKLGDDPKEIDAYLAWKQAQQAIQPAAQPASPNPPVSIASAPSAGGAQHIAVGPGVAFDEHIR